MKYITKVIASLALLGALAGPAFAAGEGGPGIYGENQVVVTLPSGNVQTKTADAAMMDMMMKEAAPMASGIVMMMHGGKMYFMTDHKMPNGKMMSDIVAGK